MSSLNVTLPNDVIVSVAFNTETFGSAPIGVPGPYISLNVGAPTGNVATIGTDDNADSVFLNANNAGGYDNGCAGGVVGQFCEDTGWAPNGTLPFRIQTEGATITVTKKLVPSYDPGRFNLLVDGTTYAHNIGDNGTTGPGNRRSRDARRVRDRRHERESRQLRAADHVLGRLGGLRHQPERQHHRRRESRLHDHEHAQALPRLTRRMRIAIVLFDGAEELDWAGPWEVLAAWSKMWPDDGVEVYTVAETPEPITCAKGLRVLADHTWDDAPTPDVVLWPGGMGTRAAAR